MDRVLSQTTYLRRSPPLFFIPLEPYPARSARHLPLAGKALSVDIVFSTYAYIRSDNARKAAFSYRSLPHWGRGTASAVDRVLSQTAYLRRSLPALFHVARTLSGSPRSPPFPRGEGVVSRKALLSYRSLPHWGRGTASAVDRVLSQTTYLRRSLPALFHTARTLSGSLRSPPSPRGEGFVRRYCFSSHMRIFALTM